MNVISVIIYHARVAVDSKLEDVNELPPQKREINVRWLSPPGGWIKPFSLVKLGV